MATSSNPSAGFHGYDHVLWYVGNATQAASYFITRMGFEYKAYQGLDTGSEAVASHVIANEDVTFVFMSPLKRLDQLDDSVFESDARIIREIHEFVRRHGDAVKDVAYKVDDVKGVYDAALKRGAIGVQRPVNLKDDLDGEVAIATIKTFGDVVHSLVNRTSYRGAFLPGYRPVTERDPVNLCLSPIDVLNIDHCVGNQNWNQLEGVEVYYEKCLGFKRFWTVDDDNMCGEWTKMNTVVVASENGAIKMPLNEPALSKKRSQIEEFAIENGGPGIQHIAFLTKNIVNCVTNLKKRGVRFLQIPPTYYEAMRERLKSTGMSLEEDLDALEHLNILIDFDEGGYLLQIFTKPLLDKPTIFLEIIQRNNFDGFGAGNFKALFQAIEREQAKRGNL